MRQWLTGEARIRSTFEPEGTAVDRDDAAPSAVDRHDAAPSAVDAALRRIKDALGTRAANRGCGVIVCGPDRHELLLHVLGYEVGEHVLAAVEDRVATIVRSDEPVLRLVGGELVIVVPDVPAVRDLVTLAERMVAAMREPVTLPDGTRHRVTISVGLAVSFDKQIGKRNDREIGREIGKRNDREIGKRNDREIGREIGREISASRLLSEAGRSRSRAEAVGGDRIVVASAEDLVTATARFEIEQDLRIAFDREQFLLHYQPIVDLTTGRTESLEALVRWHHPVRQLLHPGSFLSQVADLGLATALDRFVLTTACHQSMDVAAAGDHAPSIAVNIGAGQLISADLPVVVANAISESGLPASRLTLEIAEAALRLGDARLVPALGRLDVLGVSFALDNGTGDPAPLGLLASVSSRLSYKLDRSLLRDSSTARLVHAVAMASGILGADGAVVAQGVEDEADRERVVGVGLRLAQGFGIQRPVVAERLRLVSAGG